MSTTEFERREQLAKKTPILLSKEFDYTKIPREKVEFQRADGSWSKVQLYSSDFSSCENILACYYYFGKKARDYGWNGQLRFTRWSDSLQPAALTTWNSAVAEGPNNFLLATFEQALRLVLSRVAGTGAYEKLRDYLDAAKKPRKMSSAELAVRLKEIQDMSSFFLQEDGTQGARFTDFQLRRWFVNMHPASFITNFNNAGKKAATETIADLIEYFNQQVVRPYCSKNFKHIYYMRK
jgi:hypothetical protein